jgi:signal peptidase II
MDRSSASSGNAHPGAQLRLFAIAAAIVVADQITKLVVTASMRFGELIDVIGPFVRLTRTENTGAAFGLLRGRGVIFVVISSLAAIAIIVMRRTIARMRRWEQIAFGLILGGAIGNLIDRLRIGAVVDFIDIGVNSLRWPAFNVADSAITIGVVILALNLLILTRPAENGPAPARQDER